MRINKAEVKSAIYYTNFENFTKLSAMVNLGGFQRFDKTLF